MSHGRSFRSGARDALMQRGANSLSVFASWRYQDGSGRRAGLGRSGSRWDIRLDGADVSLGELVRQCAVVCFEPGSHALIAGAADERRRYLDWGVFHVEQEFLPVWRRYQRALKQRNSLLRAEPFPESGLFEPWEAELARTATLIQQWRVSYLNALSPHLSRQAAQLVPELGPFEVKYRPGWTYGDDLAWVLGEQRARDAARGHTTSGPHRADWSLSFEHAPLREHLSRGQEKLVALVCLLAQAHLDADIRGEWPVICLDDLASELDGSHQEAVVAGLNAAPAQVLLTGTEASVALQGRKVELFHVEQGNIRALL